MRPPPSPVHAGAVHEAFALRQHNHIFDRAQTQVEIPFRVYRNGRGYRFFGAVHEHVERELNHPIEPWMVAEGVDILHYGYLTEAGRYQKLVGRNLALLQRDFQAYPGRLLSDVLYLRDAVNIAWFEKRDRGGIASPTESALRAALDRFERVHMPARSRYYHLGRKYYDQGLAILGEGTEIHLKVGAPDAAARVHRVRRDDDAIWLASELARQHVQRGRMSG